MLARELLALDVQRILRMPGLVLLAVAVALVEILVDADDGRGADEARRRRGKVHRAGLSLGHAGLAAVHLGEEAVGLAGLGEINAVAAVRADDLVRGP